jgi:2-oxoisovalerate dehydrogenase E1 component
MSNNHLGVPMIVRAGHGEVRHAGPHHSGSYYPAWSHCPGLIVVVPSSPADAKGLMKTALRCSDPVIFLEHKSLFSIKGDVPVGEYLIPFGQANIVRAGTDLTVVTCGLLVHRALEAATALEKEGISCEIIDLRTIVPLDVETIVASVSRTHRLLVVDEAYSMCGIGAEIAAAMMENAFDELDAPVGRLHSEAVAQPFAPVLEKAAVVTVEKIAAAARDAIAGKPRAPRRPTSGQTGQRAPQSNPPAASCRPPATSAGKDAPESPPPATRKSTVAGTAINMPHGDLTVSEAKIVKWLKAVGAPVSKGEGVVEVETDKATMEVESSVDGILVEALFPEGAVVKFGEQLATVRPS